MLFQKTLSWNFFEKNVFENIEKNNVENIVRIDKNVGDNIEENIELGVGTIEIAIGKYIIQPGDTLSEIANAYETSVEQLLEDNQNIKDPNLIWAYDYLVINPY